MGFAQAVVLLVAATKGLGKSQRILPIEVASEALHVRASFHKRPWHFD